MGDQTFQAESKTEILALGKILVPLDFSTPSRDGAIRGTAVENRSMTARLARHPFFAGMNRSELATLANCAGAVRFQAGGVIFREGEVADRFYLIETGKVNLESSCGSSDPTWGWSWMFPPHVRRCTARSVEPTTALFFDTAILLEYCEQNPSFGYRFLKRLNQVMYQWLQGKLKKPAIHRRDPVCERAAAAAYGRAGAVEPEWPKVA